MSDKKITKQQAINARGLRLVVLITDPMKLAPIIRASDLLVGRDNFGSRYIGYWRAHKSEDDK